MLWLMKFEYFLFIFCFLVFSTFAGLIFFGFARPRFGLESISRFFLTLRFQLNSLIHRPTIPPTFNIRASTLPLLSVFQVDTKIPGKAHSCLFTQACNWHIKYKICQTSSSEIYNSLTAAPHSKICMNLFYNTDQSAFIHLPLSTGLIMIG